MAELSISGARKSYGDTEVIHGLDFSIKHGEFAVLVGPSGCGKSTLLRMIAGLERITSGEISIAGKVVNELEPKERNIAMVFQNYALYPHMTVYNNMAYGLKIRGMPKAEIEVRVQKAAAMLELAEFLPRKPRQLSGGQRQRVAMGRAIVRDPKVFLFDEPLSNLDAKLRIRMRTEIKELHQRLKTTTIFVTHDQVEAMTMADKIVVMQDGGIEQTGSPLELYNHPKNVFVATFIGAPAMNMIHGTARNDGTPGVEANGDHLPVLAGSAVEDGQSVIYGIRPEHLDLADDGFPAKIAVVEPTGPETLVFLRFGETDIVAAFRDWHDFEPGQTVHLLPRADKAHLFDSATGARI